jgi:hypothetical protein
MKTSLPTHRSPSAIPPDSAQLAIGSVEWRRVGPMQRLVKVEHEARLSASNALNKPSRDDMRQRAA